MAKEQRDGKITLGNICLMDGEAWLIAIAEARYREAT